MAGALSGAIGSAAGNPMDILKVRQQGSPISEVLPLRWYAKDIYHNQGGLLGFYRGLIPCVTRAVILNAIYMGNYDTVKHGLINRGYMKEGIPCQFVASTITGLAIVLATSPVDNIKTRVYSVRNSVKDGLEYNGMIDCAKKMYQNEGGLPAFYRGFGGQWARVAPLAVIQLVSWEALRKYFGFEGI